MKKNKNIETLLIGEKIKYNRKYNKQAIASINKFIKENGSGGSRIVSHWIADNCNINVSYKIINELKTKKLLT